MVFLGNFLIFYSFADAAVKLYYFSSTITWSFIEKWQETREKERKGEKEGQNIGRNIENTLNSKERITIFSRLHSMCN